MQTIGERLEEARKKKGVSIREAAEATKIRGDYLHKFEGNQFKIGLTEIYVRGFLRNYAVFLGLPADRILSDFTALGHSDVRPRQPSREVYGRMDVSIVSADERGERPATGAEAPPANEPARAVPHVTRAHSTGVPVGQRIDPALVFKAMIVLGMVLGVLLLIWVVKSLMGGNSTAAERNPAPAAQIAAAPTLTIEALEPVRIKVVRESDSSQLYQGPLEANERREFPNVPLYITASNLDSIRIEYKGQVHTAPLKGYGRVKIDFSTSK